MIEHRLKTLIPKFEGKKVLIVGDLMLDEHIWSKVNRISPEAPVVVADVVRISHVPGGCGNVAANITALGGYPILVGIVGRDSSGDKLGRALRNLGIDTRHLITTSERPTTLKSRIIAGSQQVVRVDREEKDRVSEKLSRQILSAASQLIKKVDAVIISDYGKGVLSNQNCRQVIRLAKRYRKPVLADPKGNDYSKYRGITIMTPNQLEAETATGIKITDADSLEKAGQKLFKDLKLPNLMITRGREGQSLFEKGKKRFDIPAVPREVFDITGAGDTVIATLALGIAAGAALHDAALLSNYAASVKVGKIATQPVYRMELEEALEEREPAGRKIKARSDLAPIIKKLKAEGAKIVFTNGCFDILHLGHVRYLKEAKKLGDILVVGLNSDSSVRKLKGKDRPYVSELERAEILASLECVDYVVIFSETRPDNLIKFLRPDIHVKGGDYSVEELPERHLVRSLGGKVVVIPPIKGRSTTSLIERILNRK
ncbi:D-glycero-beta-D-manno-heptose-7-phosphate kinase [Candidatus Saganbacteria bacterium]|nr:D-glycero-beta-D-manno-heptose-7-phosphate kinase [Candidatus Saganbacteria bacterium]